MLDTWFILREPGCVPELKGPQPAANIKGFLIELMEARPTAFITVLTIHEGERPSVQDGPECLEMLDGRCRGRARSHWLNTRRAHG